MTNSNDNNDLILRSRTFVTRREGFPVRVHMQCLSGPKGTHVALKLTIDGEDQQALVDAASEEEMEKLLSLAVDAFAATARIRDQYPRSKPTNPIWPVW